jgi:hypothetical protein
MLAIFIRRGIPVDRLFLDLPGLRAYWITNHNY